MHLIKIGSSLSFLDLLVKLLLGKRKRNEIIEMEIFPLILGGFLEWSKIYTRRICE